jgi:hypothetical protein
MLKLFQENKKILIGSSIVALAVGGVIYYFSTLKSEIAKN